MRYLASRSSSSMSAARAVITGGDISISRTTSSASGTWDAIAGHAVTPARPVQLRGATDIRRRSIRRASATPTRSARLLEPASQEQKADGRATGGAGALRAGEAISAPTTNSRTLPASTPRPAPPSPARRCASSGSMSTSPPARGVSMDVASSSVPGLQPPDRCGISARRQRTTSTSAFVCTRGGRSSPPCGHGSASRLLLRQHRSPHRPGRRLLPDVGGWCVGQSSTPRAGDAQVPSARANDRGRAGHRLPPGGDVALRVSPAEESRVHAPAPALPGVGRGRERVGQRRAGGQRSGWWVPADVRSRESGRRSDEVEAGA